MTSKARQLADLGGDTANLEDISSVLSSGPLSNRNLIINGAMQVAQRGTSFTGLSNGDAQYTLDRMYFNEGGVVTYAVSITQDSDAPAGLGKSLKIAVTTAQPTLTSNHMMRIYTGLEGQNLQQLRKGTSNAQPITLSFWAKSNKTGTYIAQIRDIDNDRAISKSYTVDTADTWEYKTVTYDGDTTGSFDNDNAESLRLTFFFAAGPDVQSSPLATSWGANDTTSWATGQVNLADSTSNYFNLTGVQLEVGDTATPFEHRSFGQELALCQRYYQRWEDNGTTWLIATGHATTNTIAQFAFRFNGVMRASPTMSSGGNTSAFHFGSYSQSSYESSIPLFELTTPHATRIRDNTFGSLNGDSATFAYMLGGNGGYIEANAEL